MAQAVFYLFLLIRISAGDEINAQNIDDGNIQEKLKIIFKILINREYFLKREIISLSVPVTRLF